MQKRRGFSLVELFVVISILALLMAILVPAIQKVRATAARIRCASQLRQLGLALHQHHDTMEYFPAGMTSPTGPTPYMGWFPPLLPYLEQSAMWEETQQSYQMGNPFAERDHPTFSRKISLFLCPADPRIDLMSPIRLTAVDPTNLSYQAALCSYQGVSGINRMDLSGMLYMESHTTILSVSDGSSNTLLVGERPPSADLRLGWWYAGSGDDGHGTGDFVMGVEEIGPGKGRYRKCPLGPYAFGPGNFNTRCDYLHYWSPHSGGAQFLYVDGSVHFLPYSAKSLMAALATRAGGEVAVAPY